MSLSPNEAAQSLSDVEQATRRSAQLFHYNRAAPHFLLWGAIWVVGYTATDYVPQQGNLIWAALVLGGAIGSALVGRTNPTCTTQAGRQWGLRMFGLIAIACVFMGATYAIMGPVHGLQPAAFPALIVGTVYCGVGLWAGMRWLIVGTLVIVLTLGGYFYLPQHYLLWMAFVGGGALIVAGLWFRRA